MGEQTLENSSNFQVWKAAMWALLRTGCMRGDVPPSDADFLIIIPGRDLVHRIQY